MGDRHHYFALARRADLPHCSRWQMHERQIQAAQAQQEAFRQYVQETATSSSSSTADQLAKLADLRDKGVITPAEFETEKAKALAAS